MSDIKNQNEYILNNLLKNSEGVVYIDKDFDLPTEMDFLAENFSVDLYNKMKETQSDYPLYLETPFSTTPGYYANERVFIAKAVPYVKDLVVKKLGQDDDAIVLSEMNASLYQDDGDTIYFMNRTLFSGSSAFSLGDRSYKNLDEFLNVQNNKNGKFGVRFLGINAPEVPHYISMPMIPEDVHEFIYNDAKNKSNMTMLKYKITASGETQDRADDEKIKFFYDGENNIYYEIIESYFPPAYIDLSDEEKKHLDSLNGFIAKILYVDDSTKETIKIGIAAAHVVRELVGKSEDVCLMLDQQSLTRQSNYYDSPYNDDYFSYDFAHGTTPWTTVKNYWNRFFSDARYKYLGFNAWGQDNNKRMLGTVYLKTVVPEIGGDPVWINLSKYILQKFSKGVEALPDYTSDPKENAQNGFVSSAFKLWTYNFEDQVIMDAFTSYTDDFIAERDLVFERLAGINMKSIKEYSAILGDNVFIIPPTSIRCLTQVQSERVQLLRSRGSAVKQAPISEKMIELKLYFNNDANINGTPYEVTLPNGQKTTYYMNGLRSLIAQFKLTPFLPIENDYINQTLNVFAVTLMDLQVSTMPGFPQCLQVTLTLQEFNYHVYMPELPLPELLKEDDLSINMFARCIHYPVMRWYYQRLLQKGEKIKNLDFNSPEYIGETFGSNTALVPMNFDDSKIEFYLPDKRHLDKRMQVALEKESKPIRPYYPLTENGEELIRKMAPAYNGLIADSFKEETKALGKQIVDPYIVDYSTLEDYYGHYLFDVKNNKGYMNEDETFSASDIYTFKLVGNKDLLNSKQSTNYHSKMATNFSKIDFILANGIENTASFVNATAETFSFDTGIGNLTGEPDVAKACRNYFNSLGSLSTFGPYEVKESLVEDKNGVEGKFIFTVYLPMPQLLESEVEREEFKKMIITNLGVTNYDDIFGYNEAGALCVKIDFIIPSLVYRINLLDDKNKSTIHIANGDITLDMHSNGLLFLNYCNKNVKNIQLEDGTIEYLDYVGDAAANMTKEAEAYNDFNYLESEKSIVFEKYDFGEDINIQSINCIYSNSLARVRLNAMDGYAHQFCGGQDSIIEIAITTKNEAVVSLLQNLPRLAASYVIDYKEILPCWPLRIKSEITKLFGVNEVLVESVDVSTVQGFPGLYSINMRMVGVDRSTRNREALKKLEDINNSGSIANDVNNEYMQRTYFDLKRVLGKAEIYPDLELPTIDDLEYAGYKLIKYYNPNENTRTYLDPDFYFVYAHILTNELLRAGILKGFQEQELALGMELTDKNGAAYIIEEGKKSEENPTPYPIIATAQNEAAIMMEEKSKEAYETRIFSEVGDTLNKKGWQDLSEKTKLSSKLSQTVAGLQTPVWSITSEYVFPLREKQYKMIYKDDEQNKNAGIYFEQIKQHEDKIHLIINEEFNRPIDLKAISIDEITQDNFPARELVNADTLLKWAEKRITKFAGEYSKKRGFLSGLAHENLDSPSGYAYFDFTKWVANLLLAFADGMTGFAFCEDKKVFTANVLNTEEDKYSNVNWKLKMFLNYGSKVYEKNTVFWKVLEPYCKTKGTNREFAMNVDDAIAHGTSFGIYQIQMYPKASIMHLMVSKYEQEQVSKSEIEFFFLDPYYRSLQLNDPNGKELENYKLGLLIDPAFCAYAYLRNLMVWYKYLIQEEIALSMYETIKQTASEKAFATNLGKDIKTNLYGVITDSFIDEDNNEKQTNAVYEAVFKEHAEVFATAYAAAYLTANNNELASQEALTDEGVPEELISYVDKKKNKTIEDVAKLTTKIRKKLVDANNKNSLSAEEKQVEVANYTLMLTVLGYNPDDDSFFDVTKESIIRYGTEITRQYAIQKEQSRINNQTFKEIYDQLSSDKKNIITAKLIGLSFLYIKNGGNILSAMRKREMEELNSLVLSLSTPIIDGENNLLRKYLLALDGRNAIKLNRVGTSNQTAEELMKLALAERISISRCDDIKAYLKDSYLDMIQNDKRGRMVRAFPTYYMLFIDEGREIGLWKLHDNFYNMNAISEVTVTKSRKIAADTAQIVMSNMFKTFSADDTQRDYETAEINTVRYNMRDAFNSIFSPRVYAMKEEQKRQMQELQRTAQIQAGVRIHIRMGYSANAADLPILFNGNIAEVGTADLVDIVAQGDGSELLNPITDIDDAADVENKEKFFISKIVDNWLTNGATPRQILTSLLTSRGTWLQELTRNLSNGRFFNKNPYGIIHFGDQEYKDTFSSGEVAQNIYEANPRATYGAHEKYSGLEENYNTSSTPVISMHLLGKTYWDVMHICASAQPDFIASVVPFGMRSSVFYGAPRYYYAYDYVQKTLENGGVYTQEKRKPFQQYHVYSSFTDIIHNNIRASAKEIKTNAIGLYQERQLFGDKVKQVGPLFVDFDIYPEYQKSMTVDTQLWAKGMPVLGNMFGWTADLSKDVSDKGLNPIPGAKEIAWRMTASALKNSMKDMYTGELTVIGDPTVKPYDRMFISDVYDRMDGQCEVEAVVHSLSVSNGFTTSIYADCISVVDDAYEQYANMFNNKLLGYVVTTLTVNCIGLVFNWHGRPIVSSLIKMSSIPVAASANMIKNVGSFLGQDDLQIADKVIKGNDYLLQLTGHSTESTFISAFTNNVKSSTSKLKAFASIDVVDVIQAESYLSNLQKALESLDDNVLRKEIVKQVSSDNVVAAQKALLEYDEVISLKKQAIKAYTKSDKALMKSVSKLAGNEGLDDISKVVLNEFRSNPNFLSEAKNVKRFNKALNASAHLGDDALDVARSLKVVMRNSDDIAKIALSASDDLIKKGGIKSLFSFGNGNLFAGMAATGVWPTLILIALEAAVTALIAGYVTEFVYRYLQNLEVLKIYPLKRKGRVMVAGIDGHKGVVVGSPTEAQQGEFTAFMSSLFDGEKGNFAKSCIDYFLGDNEVNQVARRLRRDNGLPEKQGDVNSEIVLENIKQSMARDINAIYSNNSKFSAREIMRVERIPNLTSKYVDYLEENIIVPSEQNSPKSIDLALKTKPIQEDEEIKKYLDSNFVDIFTFDQQGSIEEISVNFSGKDVSLKCYKSSTGAWIVPCLRPDATLLLKDAIRILFDQSGIADYDTEEIELPHVFINSATIIGGKASWENTGLAFRLLLDATRYTADDVVTFKKKVEDYYTSLSVLNYMEIKQVPNNTQELIFIVKPIKEGY